MSSVHISEQLLRSYATGRLAGEEAVSVESHVTSCSQCQDLLEQMEARIESAPPALEDRAWMDRSRFGKLCALAVASGLAAAAALFVVSRRPPAVSGTYEVALHSTRGLEEPGIIRAPQGHALILRIDVSEFPFQQEYEVEIADEGGGIIWSGVARPNGRELAVRLNQRLKKGQYWVRIFDSIPPKSPLREFGLRVG